MLSLTGILSKYEIDGFSEDFHTTKFKFIRKSSIFLTGFRVGLNFIVWRLLAKAPNSNFESISKNVDSVGFRYTRDSRIDKKYSEIAQNQIMNEKCRRF